MWQRRRGSLLAGLLTLLLVVIPPPIPVVGQQEAVPIPAGTILLTDDFADPSSGWDVSTHSGGRSGYDNGEYRVVAEPHGVGVRFGYRDEVARDFVVEVDGRLPGGGANEALYLGVRFKSTIGGAPGGYVRLVVAPVQGRAAIGLNTWNGSSWSSQRLAEVNDHPAIRRGSEVNRLGFKVRGNTFVAYTNDQEILRAQDDTYPEGGFTLGVIGPQGATTEARFDNLLVREVVGE
ncbi:MAG: hypothetical protein U0821_16170 [Chloroflexota bacterium]